VEREQTQGKEGGWPAAARAHLSAPLAPAVRGEERRVRDGVGESGRRWKGEGKSNRTADLRGLLGLSQENRNLCFYSILQITKTSYNPRSRFWVYYFYFIEEKSQENLRNFPKVN
jgi:hypothetical protein